MSQRRQPILLVDDNPDDVEMTVMAFKKSSIACELMVVNDGEEGLDYLFGTGAWKGRDPRALPPLVLLDLNLPRMSGLEVLRRIRADARTKVLPVVVLTTSNEHNDILSSYSLGANSYVRKPVDFGQFVEAVRQLGLYWLVLNEHPPVGALAWQARGR